jgi:hypothetical protein
LLGQLNRTLVAVGIAAALALPASAVAKGHAGGKGKHGGSHARGHSGKQKHKRHNPLVSYNFKGVVASVDQAAKTVVVSIDHANRHGRKFVGQDLAFNFSNTRLVVADVNSDGDRDLGDVSEGDRIKVRVRLPRKPGDLASETIEARKMSAKCEDTSDASAEDSPESDDEDTGDVEDEPAADDSPEADEPEGT